MNTNIVKLLYGYLDLQELSRLRPICKSFRDLIDRDFEMLFKKALCNIGPHNDINLLIMLVVKNRNLLLRVLQKIKPATGHILDCSGVALFVLVSTLYDNDEEILSYLDIPHTPLMGMEDRIGMAFRNELKPFKHSYYSNSQYGVDMNIWGAIVTEFVHGIFDRNVKDFQINWEEVRKWNKTPFFGFIKGALKKMDYANILVGISRLSRNTIKRNLKEIETFAKEIFDPMIEDEVALITNVQSGKSVNIVGYNLALNRRMPTIDDIDAVSQHRRLQFIVTDSVIRALVTTSALISDALFKYFWIRANEVFDFSTDTSVSDIHTNAIVCNNKEILKFPDIEIDT